MRAPYLLCLCLLFAVLTSLHHAQGQVHDVLFCGEKIPVHNNNVSFKLMNVIREQIPYVNLPELRKRVQRHLPYIELYLKKFGLPDDLKYVAIVESGFTNSVSPAGARGIWQLMPETAREKGLLVSDVTDDRDDIDKSTRAACYLLAEYFFAIRKRYNLSSWVLTVAAYNFGIGNLYKSISKHGNDYFTMQLNPETAVYVYKIIAVKELFEFPEYYLNDFGFNVFTRLSKASEMMPVTDDSLFTSVELQVPVSETEAVSPQPSFTYVGATIKGRYNNFTDRNLVKIVLQEEFDFKGIYRAKGSVLQGTGWLLDGKVLIDLGFSGHDVVVYDKNGNGGALSNRGIPLSGLKNNEPVLLKILVE